MADDVFLHDIRKPGGEGCDDPGVLEVVFSQPPQSLDDGSRRSVSPAHYARSRMSQANRSPVNGDDAAWPIGQIAGFGRHRVREAELVRGGGAIAHDAHIVSSSDSGNDCVHIGGGRPIQHPADSGPIVETGANPSKVFLLREP